MATNPALHKILERILDTKDEERYSQAGELKQE
jgi:hypothetical protein